MASRKSGKKKSLMLFLNFKRKVNNLRLFEKGITSLHIDRPTIILPILLPYFFQTSFPLSPTFNLSPPRSTQNPFSVASEFYFLFLFFCKEIKKTIEVALVYNNHFSDWSYGFHFIKLFNIFRLPTGHKIYNGNYSFHFLVNCFVLYFSRICQ
jgi:hypothetical protein